MNCLFMVLNQPQGIINTEQQVSIIIEALNKMIMLKKEPVSETSNIVFDCANHMNGSRWNGATYFFTHHIFLLNVKSPSCTAVRKMEGKSMTPTYMLSSSSIPSIQDLYLTVSDYQKSDRRLQIRDK